MPGIGAGAAGAAAGCGAAAFLFAFLRAGLRAADFFAAFFFFRAGAARFAFLVFALAFFRFFAMDRPPDRCG